MIRYPTYCLGPLKSVDLEGLDLTLTMQSNILQFMESSHSPSALLSQKLQSGELGIKTMQGFYSWDKEAIRQCRDKIVAHLVRWNRDFNSE